MISFVVGFSVTGVMLSDLEKEVMSFGFFKFIVIMK